MHEKKSEEFRGYRIGGSLREPQPLELKEAHRGGIAKVNQWRERVQ